MLIRNPHCAPGCGAAPARDRRGSRRLRRCARGRHGCRLRMTALAKYARLEAQARYFDGQSARSQDVVLGFGKRTLVIYGPDNEGDRVTGRSPRCARLTPRGSDSKRSSFPEHRLGRACWWSNDPLMMDQPSPRSAPTSSGVRSMRRGCGTAGLLWGIGAIVSVVLIVFVPRSPRSWPRSSRNTSRPSASRPWETRWWARSQRSSAQPSDDDDGMCRTPDGTAGAQGEDGRPAGQTCVELPYPLQVAGARPRVW